MLWPGALRQPLLHILFNIADNQLRHAALHRSF